MILTRSATAENNVDWANPNNALMSLPPLEEVKEQLLKTRKKPRTYRKLEKIDLSDVPAQPLILKNQLPKEFNDNTRKRRTNCNSSKYTGVYFDSKQKKWKAQMMIDGNVRSLGYHNSEEDAAAVYSKAAYKYKSKRISNVYGGMDLSDIPDQPLLRRHNVASQFKGVHKNKDRWEAKIDGKCLGTFDTAEEAAGIYARAAFYLSQRQNEATETAAPAAQGPAYSTRHDQSDLETQASMSAVYSTLQSQAMPPMLNPPMIQMQEVAPAAHAFMNMPSLDLPVAANQKWSNFSTDTQAVAIQFHEPHFGTEALAESEEFWGPIIEI